MFLGETLPRERVGQENSLVPGKGEGTNRRGGEEMFLGEMTCLQEEMKDWTREDGHQGGCYRQNPHPCAQTHCVYPEGTNGCSP